MTYNQKAHYFIITRQISASKAMVKFYNNANEALEGLLQNSISIMSGGFGLCGIPENSINEILSRGCSDLTVISNNCGIDDFGLGLLLQTRQIKKMISSYVGENKIFEQQYLNGELELELNPQGTLAERIRAGGAGIPAFYTRTGVNTVVADGKETKEFDGKLYLMEKALTADIAIIKAWKADKYGNIIYRKTARNFNQIMVTAAKNTVIEVEELVDHLDPDSIHTPNIFVHRVFVGTNYQKRIEKLTIREG